MFLGMGHNNAGGHQWSNHHTLASGQASSSEHPGTPWTPREMKQVRHIPPEVDAGVPQTEFAIIHGPSTTGLMEKSHWLRAQPLTD